MTDPLAQDLERIQNVVLHDHGQMVMAEAYAKYKQRGRGAVVIWVSDSEPLSITYAVGKELIGLHVGEGATALRRKVKEYDPDREIVLCVSKHLGPMNCSTISSRIVGPSTPRSLYEKTARGPSA